MATTQKPQLAALKTPLSASYPSELRSPLAATPTNIKQEEGQKTPISPPAAYLDFLSKLSPALMSPLSAGGTSRYTFPEKPPLPSTTSSESVATIASAASSQSCTSTATAGTTAPETSRPDSPSSIPSSRSSSCSSCSHKPELLNTKSAPPPHSPYSRPGSARTPRLLLIPQSSYTSGSVRSPLSAGSQSQYSPYSAVMSPREPWDPEKGHRSTTVNVRSVVTRTVTYASSSRTPIVEPVPPSKKRRTEESSD